MLMMRLTFAPLRRCFLGRGFWEITWPVLTAEYLCAIFPVRQCARVMLRRASLSDLPFTFGTMHGLAAKVAVAERARCIVTLHVRVPEQAPVQPLKVEPLRGDAFNVTVVP